MNERPAPSPPDTPPPALLQAGRAGPALRVPLVLLCQETGISPLRPAPPPPQHHAHATPTELLPATQPPRPGPTGRGARNAPAAPLERTRQSERARPPPPPPARRPRSRSRRCPRRPRPALSSLLEAAGARVPRGGARQTMGQRGRGAAWRSADLWLS